MPLMVLLEWKSSQSPISIQPQVAPKVKSCFVINNILLGYNNNLRELWTLKLQLLFTTSHKGIGALCGICIALIIVVQVGVTLWYD